MPSLTLPANGWTPRAYQREAWRALRNPDIKTLVLAWARRHGKDDIALRGTSIKAMERVGNYYHALPQYSQARKAIWDARNPHTGMVRWKEAFPKEMIQHVDNQTMMVTFVNGSTWQLVGSDNIDALMGTTPVGIVFSESALSDPTTFAFFRPILLENDGWSMHVSSTRGKNHFHDIYELAKSNPASFASHISARDTDVFSPEQLQAELLAYVRLYGETLGRSLYEQEYLSNWDAAVVGAVWGKELADLDTEGRVTIFGHDPRYPVDTSWDIGVGDATVIFFWQMIGNQPRLIDWYSASDTGLDHFAEVVHGKRYRYMNHIGPHDIAAREWGANGVSRKSQAKRFGIDFKAMPNVAKSDSIALASQLIKRMWVNADPDNPAKNPEDDCGFILNALKQYHFKFDETKRILSKNPVHDWTSHYADALATYALFTETSTSIAQPNSPAMADPDMAFRDVRLRDMMASRKRHTAWG